ncbi:uncharacterized protein UDID_17769 [Ustilago sp. UG-2017a]|nr:uncharacterized protein UDID_17769 [Ustilago sp. UG-2017a]
MEEGGDVSQFLGIKISRNREARTMSLEQTSYIKQLLNEHLDKHQRKSSIPLQDIPIPEMTASTMERKEYPQIVGKLLWLSNGTRPDISQAVGVLARCHGPGCAGSRRIRWFIWRERRDQGIRQIMGFAAEFTEICHRISSMTDLTEIGMNEGGTTNSARIHGSYDRVTDSVEISGKDDSVAKLHMQVVGPSAAKRRTKLRNMQLVTTQGATRLRPVVCRRSKGKEQCQAPASKSGGGGAVSKRLTLNPGRTGASRGSWRRRHLCWGL